MSEKALLLLLLLLEYEGRKCVFFTGRLRPSATHDDPAEHHGTLGELSRTPLFRVRRDDDSVMSANEEEAAKEEAAAADEAAGRVGEAGGRVSGLLLPD